MINIEAEEKKNTPLSPLYARSNISFECKFVYKWESFSATVKNSGVRSQSQDASLMSTRLTHYLLGVSSNKTKLLKFFGLRTDITVFV